MDLRKSVPEEALGRLVNKLKHLNSIIDVHLERIGMLNYLPTLVSAGTTSRTRVSAPTWSVLWRRVDEPVGPRPSPIHIATAIAMAGNWYR